MLLEKVTTNEYGARELKRTIHRYLTQPLSVLVANGRIARDSTVRVDVASPEGDTLSIEPSAAEPATAVERIAILVVDDNRRLLNWFEEELGRNGYRVVTSETVEGARARFREDRPDAALIDLLLPDGDGLALCRELRREAPTLPIVAMTGATLDAEDARAFEELDIPVLGKPFLETDLLSALSIRRTGGQALREKPA
jgi:CheY-like chemotaxis protein